MYNKKDYDKKGYAKECMERTRKSSVKANKGFNELSEKISKLKKAY